MTMHATHRHLDGCTNPQPVREEKPMGYVERCSTCKMPVVIHIDFAEVNAHQRPPVEVLAWVNEELYLLMRLGILGPRGN